VLGLVGVGAANTKHFSASYPQNVELTVLAQTGLQYIIALMVLRDHRVKRCAGCASSVR